MSPLEKIRETGRARRRAVLDRMRERLNQDTTPYSEEELRQLREEYGVVAREAKSLARQALVKREEAQKAEVRAEALNTEAEAYESFIGYAIRALGSQ